MRLGILWTEARDNGPKRKGMKMKNVLKSKTAGFETVVGTEWPVEIELVQWADDATFTVQAFCNSQDRGCQDFDSLEDAEEYYESFGC